VGGDRQIGWCCEIVVNFIVTLALLNYEKVKINPSRLEEGNGYHFTFTFCIKKYLQLNK
jgi:hypothetical protein